MPCWGRCAILWWRLWEWKLHCPGFKNIQCFGASLSGAFPKEWGPQAHEQTAPQTCGEQQVVEQKWWTTEAMRKYFSDLQLQWMPLVKEHSYCPWNLLLCLYWDYTWCEWLGQPVPELHWSSIYQVCLPFSFTWGQTCMSIWWSLSSLQLLPHFFSFPLIS